MGIVDPSFLRTRTLAAAPSAAAIAARRAAARSALATMVLVYDGWRTDEEDAPAALLAALALSFSACRSSACLTRAYCALRGLELMAGRGRESAHHSRRQLQKALCSREDSMFAGNADHFRAPRARRLRRGAGSTQLALTPALSRGVRPMSARRLGARSRCSRWLSAAGG